MPKKKAADSPAADSTPKNGSDTDLRDKELKQLKQLKSGSTKTKSQPKAAKRATGGGLSLPNAAGIATAVAGALAIVVRAMQLTSGTEPGEMQQASSLAPGVFSQTDCHPSAPKPGARGWVANCSPRQCGKVVLDNFASSEETAALRAIAARGMSMAGGAGGPTIMDMASGALSHKDKFVDMWLAFNLTGRPPFTRSDLRPYRALTERVAQAVGTHFGATKLWLTSPSFFTEISADRPPKIDNDEYWHSHVDTLQYGSFVYTALLYLNQAGEDFEGGRLTFDSPEQRGGGGGGGGGAGGGGGGADAAATAALVSPKPGRLVLFSSGAEHPHHVEQVTRGTRLAVTIAYTCDERAAIQDFLGRAVEDSEDSEAAAAGGGGSGGGGGGGREEARSTLS